MSTFALVHAAWHGPWCWQRLVDELEALGHRAVAVDLPCDEPRAGCSAYASVVASSLAGMNDEVTLVGHSLGGLTIPLVAEARPVGRLVFLCALLPQPARSWEEQFSEQPTMIVDGFGAGLATDELGRTYWRDREAAIDTLYHDVPRAEAGQAVAWLRRQARRPYSEPCPLTTWPEVDCSYVVAQGDRVVSPDWGRRSARAHLGTDAAELSGGHSPFLSRPRELAQLLVSLDS